MFKSPAAHGSNPLDFVNSGLEHLVIDALSPQHLSTVGPRSKPRINTSCSPISTTYHGSQNEKLNSKIEREREIYSNSKRDEARIRKELEESKVLLLSETQKNEEENHQEVESVKAHYDILISVREAQHRDEISRINNDNKNEIEKLMEENFIQTESNLRNFKAQKDVIEQSFHDETLRNEAIVDGLQKRIRKMEKHSILTLNSLNEREIENSRMIEDRRKAVEEIEFAFQLRELQLTRLLEESNSQLQNKMWNPHFLEVASNIQVDTPMMPSAENAGMTDSSNLMDLNNEIAALTQELKDSESKFAKLKCDFEELSAHESSLKIRLSESNTKLSEGDISRTVLEDDATSLKVQIERMAMEIQDLQTREIERESLHESQVQGLQQQQQLVVAAQAKNSIRSGAIERDDSEEEDAHYPVTDEIHLQMMFDDGMLEILLPDKEVEKEGENIMEANSGHLKIEEKNRLSCFTEESETHTDGSCRVVGVGEEYYDEVEGSRKEDMVRDKKRKTKKNEHLAQKNADLKSSSVAIGDLNAVEEGAESLLVSLQCKLRKSEKKNRKLRIENERNVHEILLFNHQHYLELENENIDLVRRCSEMKELLRCELKLEYGDKVQVLPSFAFDENKMTGDHGTVSVPDIERIQLDVIGPADHNIEQDDGIYLTIKSSTIINAKDDDIFIQSTSDIKGNDFTVSAPSQIMDPVSKDAIQSEEDHSYRLNKEVAALETMLENEKRRCDAMISNYENDKTRIIVEAAEIERKNIESFRREEIRLLSIVREKEDQLSKLLENLKAIKQSERVLIDETKNRTLRKSENKIMLDRQRWKHLCAEMSEITVRMCTGALTIPEFQLKSNSTEDDTISTNFMKMVASNDSPDRYNNSRNSSSSGHLINSVSHSLAMQDYLRTSRLSGNVLVKKDYLSTLLLLAKVK